jgi:serine/threonine protein phosphatase PrpC
MDIQVELEVANRSDPGQVRSHNEDSVAVSPEYGLVILADGMGGYNAGEVASGMATAVLKNDLEADMQDWYKELTKSGTSRLHTLLQARIARANTSIYQASQSQPQYAGMGTTLVMALFRDRHVTVAHLGDSRMYRLRGSELKQVTRDHSLLQEQIDAGMLTEEQAKMSQNKNLVTRALGVDPVVDPEIRDYETAPGDLYVLCSDGLSDMVEDPQLASIMIANHDNIEQCAAELIRVANENGGRDNVSAILIKVLEHRTQSKSAVSRLLNWLK